MLGWKNSWILNLKVKDEDEADKTIVLLQDLAIQEAKNECMRQVKLAEKELMEVLKPIFKTIKSGENNIEKIQSLFEQASPECMVLEVQMKEALIEFFLLKNDFKSYFAFILEQFSGLRHMFICL